MGLPRAALRPTTFPAAPRPTCDGIAEKKLGRTDPLKRIKREFVEAYFAINAAYASLLAIRGRRGRKSGAAERPLLQAIETALLAKNDLEDKYAPYGIAVSPVFKDGFTIDLHFCSRFALPAARSPRLSSSAFVTFPLPARRSARLR